MQSSRCRFGSTAWPVSFLPTLLLTIDVRTGTPSAALLFEVPDADASALPAPAPDGFPNMGARVDMVVLI